MGVDRIVALVLRVDLAPVVSEEFPPRLPPEKTFRFAVPFLFVELVALDLSILCPEANTGPEHPK